MLPLQNIGRLECWTITFEMSSLPLPATLSLHPSSSANSTSSKLYHPTATTAIPLSLPPPLLLPQSTMMKQLRLKKIQVARTIRKKSLVWIKMLR